MHLTHFQQFGNEISDRGACYLMDSLKLNSCLTQLDLVSVFSRMRCQILSVCDMLMLNVIGLDVALFWVCTFMMHMLSN